MLKIRSAKGTNDGLKESVFTSLCYRPAVM